MQDVIEVGLQQRIPALGGGIDEIGAEGPAHDVDQDVDVSPSFDGGVEQSIECVGISRVAMVNERVAAFSVQPDAQRRDGITVDVDDRRPNSVGGQIDCDCLAETTRTPRDHGDCAVQSAAFFKPSHGPDPVPLS